uniref:GST N-terminal domain-containing protein n=1 Tax=Corethron hystrix TaxID=216773 RepID=A0A7S1BU69_9STRA|mmetsp:Transcript_41164/g.96565  ORF Transcript_41164/g.96565 Transcript_41164/m.96565 type:complete len:290 (+) Transcript_41164:35-904(+)
MRSIPLQAGILALLQIVDGLLPFSTTKTRHYLFPASPLRMGGYDATVGTNPSTPIQFFTTPGNTCPYAARTFIVLKELDLPFDMTEVSGRPKPDWYLKINPRGKVPAIRVPALENEVIYESAICCEFLCDHAPASIGAPTTLLPDDSVSRARIRLLNDHCDNVFTKTQFTFLMNKDEVKDRELSLEMENALLVYEEALKRSGGPFMMGKQFTLADVHLLPFILRLKVSLYHFKNYELSLEKFPKFLAWYDLCSQRESVKEASLTEEKIIEIYEMFTKMDYSFGGLNRNK